MESRLAKLKRIRSFYDTSLFEPKLPSNSKHRHYRFKTLSGVWVKVKKRIRTKKEFIETVRKLDGGDLYYTTSTWLNPDKIKTKNEEDVTKSILLQNDLVFDFDCEEPYSIQTLELARKSAWNVYVAMKKYEDQFKFDYASFTGKKGFRLSYTDLKPELHNDPRKRIAQVTQYRKVFITELLRYIEQLKKKREVYNINTKIDEEVTTNPLCVVRVLGSVHTKTGFVTQKINPKTLKNHTSTILEKINCIFTKRPGIPSMHDMNWEMTMDKESSPRPQPLLEGKDVAGLASSHSYFVSNKVITTKCHIPVLIYQKNQKNIKKELRKLQKRFKLGTLYLLHDANDLIVISLKLFQKKQVGKMLNTTSSRSKTTFKKYGEVFFPFNIKYESELVSQDFSGQSSKSHKSFLEHKKGTNIINQGLESQSNKLKIRQRIGGRNGNHE